MTPAAYSERIDPENECSGIVALHLKRYIFALDFCRGKKVLDAACGLGYGSYYLAKEAQSVIGLDISPESIEHAKNKYKHSNLSYLQSDINHTAFPSECFDAICSFETIEHLRDIPDYLREMTRVLKAEGICVISTPQVKKTNPKPSNPHHVIEFCKKDFAHLLSKYFKEIDIYGQRRKQSELHYWVTRALDWTRLRGRMGVLTKIRGPLNAALHTTQFEHMTVDDILISKEKIDRASEMIAVCKSPVKSI